MSEENEPNITIVVPTSWAWNALYLLSMIHIIPIEEIKFVDFERIQNFKESMKHFWYMFDGSFSAEAAKEMIEFEKDFERESLKNS